MKNRDVWELTDGPQSGSYFSYSESPLSGLHYLSIRRLDALLSTSNSRRKVNSFNADEEDEFSDSSEKNNMAHLRSSRSSKKKIKESEDSEIEKKDEDIKEIKESTTYRILSSLRLISKDKNSDIRKSKRKNKTKNIDHSVSSNEKLQVDIFSDSNPLIKIDEIENNNNNDCDNDVIESVNEQLCSNLDPSEYLEIHLLPDSKEVSENESPSVYSDYSYNRLTTDTSDVSSRENLSDETQQKELFQIVEIKNDDTQKTEQMSLNENETIDEINFEKYQFKKCKSLTRKNSITKTIKGIFRKSKTEPTDSNNIIPTKLFKPALKRSLDSQPTNKFETTGSIRKTSSIKRKISNFMSINEVSQNLSRSMSVRDIKKITSNRSPSTEWSTSLKSLVENDIAVSYNDLSFVNYDALNTCSYNDVKTYNLPMNKNFRRTHSMSVHNVFYGEDSITKRYSDIIKDKEYDRTSLSTLGLNSQSEAASLPSLHDIEHKDESDTQRYRRYYMSNSEDSQTRNKIRSSGSGCSKLKRQNACRQIKRESSSSVDLQDNLLALSQLKIARDHLNTEDNQTVSTENQQYEWRKLVGSIRRRVQRHGTSQTETSEQVPSHQPVRRKSSLTHTKLDFLRKEKSREDESEASRKSDTKKENSLAKQKSVGFDFGSDLQTNKSKQETTNTKQNEQSNIVYTKLDKEKLSVKNSDNTKGVRKSDSTKSKDNVKVQKSSNFSFRSNNNKSSKNEGNKVKEDKQMNRDDFLKATMRIFLVVSPPVGKMQVRSRSLNHLDTLEQNINRQSCDSIVTETDAISGGPLKDSLSEPDCTMSRPGERLLTVPPQDSPATNTITDKSRITTTGRRQMLSRSQVSSSEYFSVSFELGEDSNIIHGKEEFLPATKGTSLSDALAKVCERRNIELSSCDIYLDGYKSPSHILYQETSALGGKSLRITGKEISNKKSSGSNHYRKPSGQSYRGRSFFSTSTEDSSALSGNTSLLLQDESKKQSKQRWSGFFSNNKDTKMESLADQLNYYSQHESFKTLISEGQDEMVNALYNLEEDWREILELSELTEKQQQQQTAIWELITTEVAYIKTLRVVTGLFLACLESLQSCNILTEIDTEKLFSNITEILECNLNFWSTYIYPAVQRMRKCRKPISPVMFHDGFLHMGEIYHPYFRYCAEQARCQHYCKEMHAHNEVFTAYLVWCETQKECNRLRLMDILVRPMQRLTKYGLLLKAIYKNTDDEYEKDCLCTMIKSVDDFVNSVNSSLRQKQDNERLRGIIARIESYDAVETKDDDLQIIVQKYNQLDLSQPMPGCPPERRRHLLLEGDLKLKDTSSSKIEVHCFLLTDILLVCKPSSKKGSGMMRVIRQPYLVDRLIITELNRETPSLALVYLNEFRTANAAFILQNNDQKKLKAWADCIRKAQNLYEQAKHTPSMGLTRQFSSSVPGDDFLDPDYSLDYVMEGESHLQSLIPRSPLASSSRASRVSSLAHSHSGSVEMNDQSSIGSINQSRGISIENENRTASISSDEGIQPLPPDKSPINQKNSLKQRLFLTSPKTLTPNTLSVQPYTNLGQSLPNLTLGSPNIGTLNLSSNHNTLLVPNSNTKNGNQLLSPNQRGISYPPPSPTRGNLRRGFAITQNKNPPLIKTGHVNSTLGVTSLQDTQEPTSFDFDVPVIAGVSPQDDFCESSFSRGQHRQAMTKRGRSDSRRYHTAGVVDDIKKSDEKDASILKRLSWNCGPTNNSQAQTEDHNT